MELSRLVRDSIQPRLASPLILIVLAISALWFSHVHQSLWLDELQTAWVVGASFSETASRAFHTQGFTPFYYFMIWALRPLLGMSEIGLRIPSIVLTLASALLVNRVAGVFFAKREAAIAALLFVCLDSVIETAITARPYSLALFLALLSFYSFEKWLRQRQVGFKILYIFSSLLTIYAHFLFTGILALELLYWALYRQRSKVSLFQVACTYVYVAIGIVPTIPQIQSMLEKRDLMAIARMPTIFDLVLSSVPWLTCIAAVIAFFAAAACNPKGSPARDSDGARPLDRIDWVFLASWTFLPALLLFLGSYLLGTSMFVPRYFEWASPGAALLGTAFYSQLKSERSKLLLPLFFVIFSVAAEYTKDREPEDWRSAVKHLHELHKAHSGPVLFYSGVIESSNAGWLVDPIKQGQFLSPILYYQVPQPVFLLPFEFSSQAAQTYWERTVVPHLAPEGRLYLLILDNLSWSAEDGSRVSIREEIKKLLLKEGYAMCSEEPFKRVWIMSFDKSKS